MTPLTATADAAEHEPSWSPDSSRIAFTRALASGAAEIYTMARDRNDPRRLTTGGYRDNSPVWSPDGTRIAYDHPFGQISVFGGFGNVLTMRASDGGDQRDVTRYTTAAPRFACPTSWQACHAGVTKRCTSPLVAQVTPPPPSPSPRPTSSPSPSPRSPGAAPVVSRLRVSPGRFRAARSGAPVKAAVRTGARVGYRLNVAARVRFVVGRAHPGRRVGRRCVRPTRGNRSRGRCIRLVRVRGSSDAIGPRRRPVQVHRPAGRAHPEAGRYALVAAATARGRTGSPAAARFRTSALSPVGTMCRCTAPSRSRRSSSP